MNKLKGLIEGREQWVPMVRKWEVKERGAFGTIVDHKEEPPLVVSRRC